MNPRRHVLLYMAPFCAECQRARALLERRGIVFEEIDLSADPDRCCELEALTGGRSVPQLVIDGRPIGGFGELAALDRAAASEAGTSRGPSAAASAYRGTPRSNTRSWACADAH